ncbi:MAG: gamma-glutamylcyclotransferase family protein [Candidatus Undinarchaeales archaeon]|jgi:gamma-glutamylcyclotransferase (GGCT)/AIG2-like uncharacterized protein YtfP|nr:gamma-glutamylcyclotransferase family protein [Candidatus Undinarchaeales archaeon]
MGTADEGAGDSSVLIVYGTLRRGEHNYRLCGLEDGATYLGTVRLSGWAMRSLGHCPAVHASDSTNDGIVVEAYRVHDRTVYDRIDALESGAGYDRREVTVEVDSMTVTGTIYIMSEGRLEGCPSVPFGDWVSFSRKQCLSSRG